MGTWQGVPCSITRAVLPGKFTSHTPGDTAVLDIHRPNSIEDTVEALASNPGASLLAGGTDLMVEVNLRHFRPQAVISLRGVHELEEMDSRFIGAGVTHARLESSPYLALAQAARTIGSRQIRAMGTIGGNLGTASPAGDTLPFLVAVEALVVLASTRGVRKLPVGEFLVGPKATARAADELIVGLELPTGVPERQGFAKVGVRQAMVISTASACVLRGEDGETRVALGSVGPTVVRAPLSESFAGAERLDAAGLAEFQRLVESEARPITDHRATAEYRRHAVGVIGRRVLERVLA